MYKVVIGLRMYIRRKIRARWLFVFAVILAASAVIGYKATAAITELAQVQAKHRVLGIINSVVNSYITEAGDMYNDMLIKDKSETGSIFAVNTDIGKISRLQSEISVRIQEEINKNSEMRVKISLANILGFKAITSGKIGISADIAPVSGVLVKFEDSFTDAGINQTKFTVNLNIKTDIRVILPPLGGSAAVDHTIPVAQIILLGNVPEQYTTISGAGGVVVGQ